MGDFVKASTPLPARKVDARPPIIPEQEIDAADVNNLWDAVGDVRTALPYVSVKTYGATGDGTTDDTTTIQNAITAANGGTVFFPSGTYKVTNTINVSVAGTTLRSAGAKIYVAFGASTPASGILFNITASHVTFDGLWFDSTGTSATTTTNKYIVKYTGTSGAHLSNSIVRNCKFTNLPWADNFTLVVATHCVYAGFADLTVVEDCVFDSVGGAAVFTSQLTDLKVMRNRINNTGWYSIQLQALVVTALIDGNSITGTVAGGRVWGGSVNLMSNGKATIGEGLATNKNVTITNNYISGVHSYTAAVHIESSSHVLFSRNKIENVTLSQGSPFYADGTPAVYVAAYTRAFAQSGSGTFDVDEGSCNHIDISNNDLIAVATPSAGAGPLGIKVDNQHKPGVTTPLDTLRICDNFITSPDAGNAFNHCITVHGQQGGMKNVLITGNKCSGSPTDATPTGGVIGTLSSTGVPISDAVIANNRVEYLGTPASSTHTGIILGDFVQNAICHSNNVKNCWNGIRILSANAGPVFLGPGNTFSGSGSADYLFSAGPTVNISTSPRYAQMLVANRGSALAATTVVPTVPVGEYRVSFVARTATSGTGTTATVTITWTDEGGAKSFVSPTFALNAVDITGQVNGTLFIHANAAVNIQAAVAGTFGTSLYDLNVVVEKLN